MEQSLNDLLNEALFKWLEVAGVNPEQTSFSIRLDGRLGSYQLHNATKEISESREMDETGLTAWMMLRGLIEAYMKDQTFTAFNIIFDPQPIKQRLADMKVLHDALEDPLVVELIDEFVNRVRDTAKRFNFQNIDELEELLADKYDLAWIRRDALLSMNRLAVHQFTQGESDKLPIGMNPNVYEVWNVNSIVRALRSQYIPGITVCLVRDPEAMHSFFVLAVKNGDNITILTDKDEEAHPAAKRMSRRPDRDLERRANKHWFPYHLLDLKVTEDQKHLYAEVRTALVPVNTEAVKLAAIGELSARQFVWLMLVSDRILDTFWRKNFHTPELSYTGEMVVEPHALVGAEGALVKSGLYQPLELLPLKADDVTAEKTAAQWERKPTYFNAWMEQRYAAEVPEAVFNVTGEAQQKLLEASHDLLVRDHFDRPVATLEYLDPQNFGSKDKIEKDRVWAARMNQMRVIQARAKEEFDKTEKQAKAWYKERITERAEFFADAAARGELMGPFWVPKDWGHTPIRSLTDGGEYYETESHLEQKNLLTQHEGKTYHSNSMLGLGFANEWYGDTGLCEWCYDGGGYYCFDRPDIKASIMTLFTPSCPEALALFLGMDVKDLPWYMQNWYSQEPYDGNSILDRLDPVDWALDNPWMKCKWRVGVAFSKRAFAARRKALGLPPKTFTA